jgi:hypothetical protein
MIEKIPKYHHLRGAEKNYSSDSKLENSRKFGEYMKQVFPIIEDTIFKRRKR